MVSKPISVAMIETRSFPVLNDKYNALSLATDQNAQEIQGINQKLDAFTSMLQTLTQTVQELTEAGNQWHKKQATPERPVAPVALVFQETTLASVPRSVKLEFPNFKGENPAGSVYKAHQFFQLYNTPPNQKILLASYHMEEEALIWF